MSFISRIVDIERELSEKGRRVSDLCEAAGINRSTWTRWKSGATSPLMAAWERVEGAKADLLAEPPHYTLGRPHGAGVE